MSSQERNDAQGRSWMWITPALVWLASGIAIPLIIVFVYSLAQRTETGEIELGFHGLNYWRSLEPIYLTVYWRSFLLAVLTTVICLVLSFPVAVTIAQQPSRVIKNLLLFLVTLPFWTSFLIRTYAWILILRTEGLINSWLLSGGIIEQPLNLLYNDFAVLVGLVYGELPFMILPLYSVLDKMDKRILEAAADLGASGWKTFTRVLLPLSKPGVYAGVILVFVPSLGAFVTPDLLGGAKTLMVGSLIQNQFAIVRDYPFGAAVAFLLTVVVLLLLAVAHRTARRSSQLRVF